MKKSFVWLVGVFMLFGGVLAGCSSSSSSSTKAKNVPQELTYASTTKPVGLSPIMTNDSVSSSIIDQIYETLFIKDPKTMEIKPGLAESYDTPNDTTWVIHLRKNVKFQDGTPFNAEAVKYTFDKIKDPKTAAPRASLLQPIKDITVKDDNTVVITTEKPYGPLLAALSHTNASIVSPTADKKQDLMKEPVGTGPFKLKEYVSGDHVILEKNKDYWKGVPKLDKVTFKVVPDVNTEISMLQTGQVQFIDGVPAEQWDRVKSLKNVNTVKAPGTPVSYLGFNMHREPMKNLDFRKAVAYAVDRQAYVDQLKGLGIKSNSIIGPKVFGYDQSVENEGYNYDPEKAKQLIEKNGWKGLKVNMLVANTPAYMKMGEIVQDQLTKAGLDVKIQTMEWGTFLDVSKKGKYDITFLGWSNSTGDGSELLYPNLHSDNAGSSNVTFYSNPEFDKLVEESRNTVDQDKRKQFLTEANKLAVKDAPWIVMDHGVVTGATDKSVKGLQIDPTGQWSLYPVYRK
jgi:peptide/nickel transport system substrate-binding protein